MSVSVRPLLYQTLPRPTNWSSRFTLLLLLFLQKLNVRSLLECLIFYLNYLNRVYSIEAYCTSLLQRRPVNTCSVMVLLRAVVSSSYPGFLPLHGWIGVEGCCVVAGCNATGAMDLKSTGWLVCLLALYHPISPFLNPNF